MNAKHIIPKNKQQELKHLFYNILKGSYVNIFLSLFVYIYFTFSTSTFYILNYWLTGLILLSLIRIAISVKSLKLTNEHEINKAHSILCVVLILTGFLWGGLYVLEFNQMSLFQNLFSVLLLNGASTIAIVSLSNSTVCYFGFVIPTILPTIVINLMAMQYNSVFLAIGICLYNLFVILIFFENKKNINDKNKLMNKQQELIKELKIYNKQLNLTATTDDLTGLSNRRQFNSQLTSNWHHAKRALLPVSLIIVDVDYFKQYNDKYGHLKGDRCLQLIANVLKDITARQTDLAARFGGDEFALILYDTDNQGAISVTKKILRNVHKLNLTHEKSPHGFVTVSQGVATLIPDIQDTKITLLNMADKALYNAKNAGRNQVGYY